jgi:hypothetical protein
MNNKEFTLGKLSELEFSKLFDSVNFADKFSDIYEHWDIKIETKIDVKSIKKESREDLSYNENFHWVEIQNVNGEHGWLYGKADYFAFETEDYWLIVEKEKLQNFIEMKCDKTIGKTKDPYCFFSRKNRKDIIVKVKTLDLSYISDKILSKNGKTNS